MIPFAIFDVIKKQFTIKKTIKGLAMVVIFYFLIKFLGGYGILGLAVIVIGISSYRIISDVRSEKKGRQSTYLRACRDIEVMTFGKTFDKEDKEK